MPPGMSRPMPRAAAKSRPYVPKPKPASRPTEGERVPSKPPPPPPPPPKLTPEQVRARRKARTSSPSPGRTPSSPRSSRTSESTPLDAGSRMDMDGMREQHLSSQSGIFPTTLKEIIAKRYSEASLKADAWTPLRDITVNNFKVIKKAKIPLGKNVTILVGPNSCGKSSILQAIHWATRLSSNIKPGKDSKTLLFDGIDYMPSSDPIATYHKGRLGTKPRSNSITVNFRHIDNIRGKNTAKISIRTIRGDSGIRVKINGAVSPYKQNSQLISAYIPGVTGILEKETRAVHFDILRKAASGQAGEVLRNILLNLKEMKEGVPASGEFINHLEYLNSYIQEIYPDVDVAVSFDDMSELYILATIGIGSKKRRPLDTASTGILQVIHIFAYMIYFKPKVTLIEEPDTHIHPDRQGRLIEIIERAAAELNTQVILTTHSHHIVRAVSADSDIVWIKSGKPHLDEGEMVRRLLGWGGLDKSVFFFVEDEDHRAITNILGQWPDLYRKVCICPCYGVGNLPRNGLLKGVLGENKLDIKAVIHRDRDFMTDDEVEIWKQKFQSEDDSYKDVSTWVTSNSDIEAYFCDPSYLSILYGVSFEEASLWINEVMNGFNIVEKEKDFLSKREKTIMSLGEKYNSEKSEKLWAEVGLTLNTITGRVVYGALKQYLQRKRKPIEKLNSFFVPDESNVALELKDIIERAIG